MAFGHCGIVAMPDSGIVAMRHCGNATLRHCGNATLQRFQGSAARGSARHLLQTGGGKSGSHCHNAALLQCDIAAMFDGHVTIMW